MKKKFIYSVMVGCCCYVATTLSAFSQSSTSGTGTQTDQTQEDQTNQESNTGSGSAGGINAETETPESLMDLHTVMQNNMKEMKNMELKGQVDEDFAKLMAHHHKGAIDMSEVYLKSAQDDQLKQMAQKAMTKQKKEIEELEAFAKKHTVESKDASASKELMEPMNKMMKDDKSMTMENGIDHQFASMMIDHHKAGIEMAEVAINKGTHSDLREMAKKIKDDQKKEIEELQSWLGQHK